MAGTILVGIGLGSRSASASYLLPGKNAQPTLVTGYPDAHDIKSSNVPFRLQWDSDAGCTISWGFTLPHPQKPIEEHILMKAGSRALEFSVDGLILKYVDPRDEEKEEPTNRVKDPALHLREFVSQLISHIRKQGSKVFGHEENETVDYKIAINIPAWWPDDVVSESIVIPTEGPGWKASTTYVSEPVSSITFFLSKNKKHTLLSGGTVCVLNMDEDFTTVSDIWLKKTDTTVRITPCLEGCSVHSFGSSEISGIFREYLESKLRAELDFLEEEAEITYKKIQKISENFLAFLVKFDGSKDFKFRLPWSVLDKPDLAIKNGEMTVEATALREHVIKKPLGPIVDVLVAISKKTSEKVHVLCSGALSGCPYVLQALRQLLSETDRRDRFEVLKVTNGQTSACSGGAILLDSERRQTLLYLLGHWNKAKGIGFGQSNFARSTILKTQAADLKSAALNYNNSDPDHILAAKLIKRARLIFYEQLETHGFSEQAMVTLTALHSLYRSLGRDDDIRSLRNQYDDAVGPRLERCGVNVENALFYLCKYTKSIDTDSLEFITETGSPINKPAAFESFSLIYPVHVTIMYGNIVILSWLLKKKADLSVRNNEGSTPLHLSIITLGMESSYEAEEIVRMLIGACAQSPHILNAEDAAGLTALEIAKNLNLSQVMENLIVAGAKENSKKTAAKAGIIEAIEKEDVGAVRNLLGGPESQYLLKPGLSLEMNIFHWAVQKQKYRSLEAIVGHFQNDTTSLINGRALGGWAPLHYAALLGNVPIAQLLLISGAYVGIASYEMYGWAKRNEAVSMGSPGATSFQMSESTEAKKCGGWTPLHIATTMGNDLMVQTLLAHNAQPHVTDLEGFSGIQRAISNGHENIVAMLVGGSIQREEKKGFFKTKTLSLTMRPASKRLSGIFNATSLPNKRATSTVHSVGEVSRNALHDAVQANNLALVTLLLEKNMNPNALDPDTGWSPLSYAVWQGLPKIVLILLKHGSDPKIYHTDGSTLLHLAAGGQNPKIYETLLPHCSATAVDGENRNVLHYVAKGGCAAIAKSILKNNKMAGTRDSNGCPPLHVAIELGNTAVAAVLIQHDPQLGVLDNQRKTILHKAAVSPGSGRAGVQLILSNYGFHAGLLTAMDTQGNTALKVAVMSGSFEAFQALLSVYVIRNLIRECVQALFTAIEIGKHQEVTYIMTVRAECVSIQSGDHAAVHGTNGVSPMAISKAMWTPLHAAAWYGQFKIVQDLLNRRAPPPVDAPADARNGLTPLGLIAFLPKDQVKPEHILIAELLLEHRASITYGNSSILHLAAGAGHQDLLTTLLERGAAINMKDGTDKSALCQAIQCRRKEAVEVLLKAGASPNEENAGSPLLHHAVLGDDLEMTKRLIAAGANINALSKDGSTALHAAARKGNRNIFSYLLEAGAPFDARTLNHARFPSTDGLSVLDIAVSHGHLELVKNIFDSTQYKTIIGDSYEFAWRAAVEATSEHENIRKYIFERTGGLEHKGGKIVHWAIDEDKPGVLRTLIDMKVDMKIPNADGWSPIHAAAMKGKLGVITALLDSGIDVNYAGYQGRTPLHQALAANCPESASHLLLKGAKTDVLDDDSIRPIHLAIDFRAVEAIKALPLSVDDFEAKALNGKKLIELAMAMDDENLQRVLLEKETECNQKTHFWTALHQAVTYGTVEEVVKLLESGAGIECRETSADLTPLLQAVALKNQDMVGVLVDHGADINAKSRRGLTGLSSAGRNRDISMVKYLISRDADLNCTVVGDEMTPLMDASWYGDVESVESLLSAGCNIHAVDSLKDNALHHASGQGHTEIARKLVQAGIPVNSRGNTDYTALLFTINPNHTATASTLLSLGADPQLMSGTGFGTLHYATETGTPEMVQVLLENGANPEMLDKHERTPILAAAHGGREENFRLMLKAGASLTTLSNVGWNVLHYAAYGGNVNIVKLIHEVHKNPFLGSTRSKQGFTPLLVACDEGHADVLQELIAHGDDVNASSNDGENGLLRVCGASKSHPSHLEIARILLSHGQDPNSKRPAGHTCLMLAAEGGLHSLVQLLLSNGASPGIVTDKSWDATFGAAYGGNIDILKLLLSQPDMVLSMKTAGPDGKNIFHWAAGNGKVEMCAYLAAQNPSYLESRNGMGTNALIQSCLNQNLAMMKKLVELGADVKCLYEASKRNLMHIVGQCTETTNLHEIVAWLKEKGLSFETESGCKSTPLKIAADNNSIPAVTAMLDHGADINNAAGAGGPPLEVALRRGHVGMLEFLGSRGADVNSLDSDGRTWIYIATWLKLGDVVRALVRLGADVNAKCTSGWAPLHCAADHKIIEMVPVLLELGADPNLRGGGNQTALHLAASQNLVDVAACIFQNAPHVDAELQREADNETPLVVAARFGHVAFIKCLKEYRFELRWRGEQMRAAREAARVGNHAEAHQELCTW